MIAFVFAMIITLPPPAFLAGCKYHHGQRVDVWMPPAPQINIHRGEWVRCTVDLRRNRIDTGGGFVPLNYRHDWVRPAKGER